MARRFRLGQPVQSSSGLLEGVAHVRGAASLCGFVDSVDFLPLGGVVVPNNVDA